MSKKNNKNEENQKLDFDRIYKADKEIKNFIKEYREAEANNKDFVPNKTIKTKIKKTFYKVLNIFGFKKKDEQDEKVVDHAIKATLNSPEIKSLTSDEHLYNKIYLELGIVCAKEIEKHPELKDLQEHAATVLIRRDGSIFKKYLQNPNSVEPVPTISSNLMSNGVDLTPSSKYTTPRYPLRSESNSPIKAPPNKKEGGFWRK